MKERPILFSGAMVRALRDGGKTQTRRIVTGEALKWLEETRFSPQFVAAPENRLSPYGYAGDRLWVREAWRTTKDLDAYSGSRIAEMCLDAGYRKPWAPVQYEADGARVNWEHTSTPPHESDPVPGRYRHARFMPRWACRSTLEVVTVRIEQLDDISESDARAEGVTIEDRHMNGYCAGQTQPPSIRAFRELWESINGAESWNAKLWVWVVGFKDSRHAALDRMAANAEELGLYSAEDRA